MTETRKIPLARGGCSRSPGPAPLADASTSCGAQPSQTPPAKTPNIPCPQTRGRGLPRLPRPVLKATEDTWLRSSCAPAPGLSPRRPLGHALPGPSLDRMRFADADHNGRRRDPWAMPLGGGPRLPRAQSASGSATDHHRPLPLDGGVCPMGQGAGGSRRWRHPPPPQKDLEKTCGIVFGGGCRGVKGRVRHPRGIGEWGADHVEILRRGKGAWGQFRGGGGGGGGGGEFISGADSNNCGVSGGSGGGDQWVLLRAVPLVYPAVDPAEFEYPNRGANPPIPHSPVRGHTTSGRSGAGGGGWGCGPTQRYPSWRQGSCQGTGHCAPGAAPPTRSTGSRRAIWRSRDPPAALKTVACGPTSHRNVPRKGSAAMQRHFWGGGRGL